MCITKQCIAEYLDKLEKSIKQYMEMPVNERSANAVESMVEAWDTVKGLSDKLYDDGDLTKTEAEEWGRKLQNEDGSTGTHWTIEQTNSFKPYDIPDYCWNIAMNMIYSDYSKVADKYGVGTADFYADLAHAFLTDKDGGGYKKKLKAYYSSIVK